MFRIDVIDTPGWRLSVCLAFSAILHGFLLELLHDRLVQLGDIRPSRHAYALNIFLESRKIPQPAAIGNSISNNGQTTFDGADARHRRNSYPSKSDLTDHTSHVVTELNNAVATSQSYVAAWALDEKPRIVSEISRGLPGFSLIDKDYRLILELSIDEAGHVQDVVVLSSDISNEETNLISDRYLGLIFSPGRIAGVAVRSRAILEVVIAGTTPRDATWLP